MAAAPGNERLRLSPRSAVTSVALLGLTLGALAVVAAAARVLVWVALAATVAGLLEPAVARLAAIVPRGLAVAGVALTTVAVVAATSYGLVGDVVDQTRALQRAAPTRAAAVEEAGRFSAAARALNLADRTRRFVHEVPVRLRGGAPAQALQAATRRALAMLAISVLTVFFLLHGPRLAAGAAGQVRDPARRARLVRLAGAAWHRGFGYARGALAMAAGAGLLAYLAGLAVAVPGPAPLALWVALWDVVPLVGATIGALPMVALAAVRSPAQGLVLVTVFAGWQVVENLLLQRRLEQTTVRVGPFLTAAGGAAGLELYGLPGALLAVVVLAMAVAVADEVATSRDEAG